MKLRAIQKQHRKIKVIAIAQTIHPRPTMLLASEGKALVLNIMKTNVRGFFDTDLHEINWHFATHEAVRPSGF